MPGVDVQALIQAIGYAGLFAIVFSETGLLLGFFLPGDTLLITAGLMAERGELNVWILIPLLILAALVGDFVGFEIGKHAGARLYKRADSRFFKRRHLQRAETFYERHGGKTIIIARFLAVIRTFAPTVAGAAGMPYRKFVVFNAVGAALWVPTMLWLGYIFGSRVDNLEIFFTGLVALTLAASAAPAAWQLWKNRKSARPAEG